MAIAPTGAPARLTPRDVSARAVRVPLAFALGTMLRRRLGRSVRKIRRSL
ncbi:MAG: hypothetical protein WDN69_36230 [Aliidongia sp.]